MFKAYLKGEELMTHGLPKDKDVVQFCQDEGLVRVEIELRRRRLLDSGLSHFDAISDAVLARVFREETEVLRRVDRCNEPDIVAAIPSRFRSTAAAWLAGHDVKSFMSRRTLFRHAKALREVGIDILEPRNVEHFPVKVRVVELEPLAVPEWYSLKCSNF